MPLIEWEERMNTGIEIVDTQHKELVRQINCLATFLDEGWSKSHVSRCIQDFFNYTEFHFKTEESLMDYSTYPDYFNQVREHLECSLNALEYHRKFLEEKDFDLREFFDYIVRWFLEHSMGLDQTLGEHLRTRGDAPETEQSEPRCMKHC